MDFNNWLLAELGKRGWTRRELARRADISESTVYMILGGQREVSFDFCSNIAKALDLPPDAVMRRAGLLPPLPSMPSVEEKERNLLTWFRRLAGPVQDAIVSTVQSLAAKVGPQYPDEVDGEPGPRTLKEQLAYSMVEDLDQLSPEDQARVFDLMRRLRGDEGERSEDGSLSVDSD